MSGAIGSMDDVEKVLWASPRKERLKAPSWSTARTLAETSMFSVVGDVNEGLSVSTTVETALDFFTKMVRVTAEANPDSRMFEI
ncbi:hypothetical protein Plhal304r1_c022g0078321 [Plasmopara halstedii]